MEMEYESGFELGVSGLNIMENGSGSELTVPIEK